MMTRSVALILILVLGIRLVTLYNINKQLRLPLEIYFGSVFHIGSLGYLAMNLVVH